MPESMPPTLQSAAADETLVRHKLRIVHSWRTSEHELLFGAKKVPVESQVVSSSAHRDTAAAASDGGSETQAGDAKGQHSGSLEGLTATVKWVFRYSEHSVPEEVGDIPLSKDTPPHDGEFAYVLEFTLADRGTDPKAGPRVFQRAVETAYTLSGREGFVFAAADTEQPTVHARFSLRDPGAPPAQHAHNARMAFAAMKPLIPCDDALALAVAGSAEQSANADDEIDTLLSRRIVVTAIRTLRIKNGFDSQDVGVEMPACSKFVRSGGCTPASSRWGVVLPVVALAGSSSDVPSDVFRFNRSECARMLSEFRGVPVHELRTEKVLRENRVGSTRIQVSPDHPCVFFLKDLQDKGCEMRTLESGMYSILESNFDTAADIITAQYESRVPVCTVRDMFDCRLRSVHWLEKSDADAWFGDNSAKFEADEGMQSVSVDFEFEFVFYEDVVG